MTSQNRRERIAIGRRLTGKKGIQLLSKGGDNDGLFASKDVRLEKADHGREMLESGLGC
jgi:hypothetical protein